MSNTTQGLYRAFSVGVKNRKLIPADGFNDKAFELINKDPDKDHYESLYLYNEEHYKQFKATVVLPECVKA